MPFPWGGDFQTVLLAAGVAVAGAGAGHGLKRVIVNVTTGTPHPGVSLQALRPWYRTLPWLCAALSAPVALRFGAHWATLAVLLFSWILLALVFIDLEKLLLPDSLTLPLLWGGLLVNSGGMVTDLRSAVWGAVAGYVFLWAVYWVHRGLTHREGIGYGDFKLLAALGAWLGWIALPAVLVLASFSGAATGLFWLWRGGHSLHRPIPFGPFLAAAGYGVMLWSKGGSL